MNVMTAK